MTEGFGRTFTIEKTIGPSDSPFNATRLCKANPEKNLEEVSDFGSLTCPLSKSDFTV
jgi:hypothetical protein